MKPWLPAMAALLAPVALLGAAAFAQDALPLKPERVLTLHPQRTTWSSVDVSPDGKQLVFDVLGDLYTMPAAGGSATQLSEGLAFDSQPRFSPDGRWIAFTSDRSGSENLWIARADGSDPRVVTHFDDATSIVSPAWSADGRSVFASRYRADLNNYEFWQFPLAGEPRLLVPIKPAEGAPRSAWRSTLDCSASPDGRYLYYSRRVAGLEFDMPTKWTILRRTLATGEEVEVIAGSGGRGTQEETFFAPHVSPDGKSLAYVTRRDGRSLLRLRRLDTGEDLALGETELDTLQASSWLGLVPGMAFTPDGKAIVLSRYGRFVRQELGGTARVIPREITAKVDVARSTRIGLHEETGPVEAKLAMSPMPSPDGRRIAFAALGSLWVQGIGEAAAHRLDLAAEMPMQPAWSPDGRSLVFASWSEADGGAVWTAAADGSGPAKRIAALPAYYRYPVFTPDGGHILVLRSGMDERRQSNFEFGLLGKAQLVVIDPATGNARVVAEGTFGGRPQFTREARAAYLLTDKGLARVALDTGALTTVAQVNGPGWYFAEGNADADDMRISPDGAQIAAALAGRVYVLPRPADPAKPVDVTAAGTSARVLPGLGADWFEWSAPGTLDLTVGTLFSRRTAASGAEVSTVRLAASLPRAVPEGRLLLRGGRVLTMAQGDRVIEDADILIAGDRFAAIGPRGSFDVPAGTPVRDITGKTVVPGFIDAHDHAGSIRRNNWAREEWQMRARLAYGVTTSFDPSTLSIDHIGYQGLVDAGLMLGPRLRSTGPAVFSKFGVTSLGAAEDVVRRYAQGYRVSNLKEYRTGGRKVREWVAMATRDQHLVPTTEGALSLKLDLTQILDGFAGNEHALAAPPLGDDVIALMVAMRTSYVTTLSITNSGSPAMDWLIAHEDPVADAKLRRFWPPPAIWQKLAPGRDWHPLETMRFPAIARDAATLAAAGGLVGMGSHGEAPGIGFHWEMAAHALGGMTPLAVLHAATAGSAETIGRLADLGTIEPGKLADLVILDADPLSDLRNARKIAAVMRGGFLYDGETLRPLWPKAGPAPRAWFEGMDAERWLPLPAGPKAPDN